MKHEICGTCLAWNCGKNQRGECRKNPPTVHGWPKTKTDDWCVSGWKKKINLPTPVTRNPSVSSIDAVGINYAYIKAYPKEASQWLESVLADHHAIPPELASVFAALNDDLMSVASTYILGTMDSCDNLFKWAHRYPGSENNEDDKKYMSILIYADGGEDDKKNDDARRSLGDTHPWVVRCREIALECH